MVYSLGKVMWCVFEGWSHTINNVDEEYTDACAWEISEFRESPRAVWRLVVECTRGSPDWIVPPTDRLVRVGTRLEGRRLAPGRRYASLARCGRGGWRRWRGVWRPSCGGTRTSLRTEMRFFLGFHCGRRAGMSLRALDNST